MVNSFEQNVSNECLFAYVDFSKETPQTDNLSKSKWQTIVVKLPILYTNIHNSYSCCCYSGFFIYNFSSEEKIENNL